MSTVCSCVECLPSCLLSWELKTFIVIYKKTLTLTYFWHQLSDQVTFFLALSLISYSCRWKGSCKLVSIFHLFSGEWKYIFTLFLILHIVFLMSEILSIITTAMLYHIAAWKSYKEYSTIRERDQMNGGLCWWHLFKCWMMNMLNMFTILHSKNIKTQNSFSFQVVL